MKPLAQPVPANLIASELGTRSLIARFRGLEIHLISGPRAPATLDEIGRIREQEYRRVGAGRGDERDLDHRDTEWPWYLQLVSWDPEEGEVVAAYRAIRCDWAIRHGGVQALRTSTLFEFDATFVKSTLAHAVELGRSVVNAEARKAVSGLFSVWVGLGAMVREWPEVRFFFGNVSLYRSLPDRAVRAIVGFLLRHHAPAQAGVRAHRRVPWVADLLAGSPGTGGTTIPASLEELQALASAEGWPVPPILVSYLKAHPGMLAFDVAEDPDFGGAHEVAIAIPVDGLASRTVDRFITPYESVNAGSFVLPDVRPTERP